MSDLQDKLDELKAELVGLRTSHARLQIMALSLGSSSGSENISSGLTPTMDPRTTTEIQRSGYEGPRLTQIGSMSVQNTANVDHLFDWPFLESIFEEAGVTDRNYILEEVEKSLGLGSELAHGFKTRRANPRQDSVLSRSNSSHSLHTGDVEALQRHRGANPDGSFDLRSDHVWNLYDLYMRHSWTTHPVLDARWTKIEIENFVDEHAPSMTYTAKHDRAESHPKHPSQPARSTSEQDLHLMIRQWRKTFEESNRHVRVPQQTIVPSWQSPKKDPDRSLRNAITLLILAIGGLYSDEGFHGTVDVSILDDLPSRHVQTKPDKQSPTETLPQRHPWPSAGVNHECAYATRAVDILGNVLGGQSIMHAQAFLLAAMYYGYVGRPLESWSWINRASTVLSVLHRKSWYDSVRTKMLKSNR